MSDNDRGAEHVQSGDVIDLITADHRELERLFAALREDAEGRSERLRELADLLTAHSLAEEVEVYPSFRHDVPEQREEVEHGYQEHAEAYELLAALQQIDDVNSQQWEGALGELEEAVTHHAEEEESNVLEPGREKIQEAVRFQLGMAFMRAREGWLRQSPGSPDKVRELVAEHSGSGAR